jgi:hypothetical protein
MASSYSTDLKTRTNGNRVKTLVRGEIKQIQI